MRTRTTRIFTAFALTAATIAVGTHYVSGATSSNETVFVPIEPCRLVDTRAAEAIGPRNTPLPENTAVTFTAWDSGDDNSTCEIPASATAVGTNTTAVGPTANSFLTLFPEGTPVPNASNLNYTAGQAPTPNSATIPLSATGKFNAINRFGTVDLIIDINGYYQPSTNIGATGPQGPVGPAGPANRITDDQIAQLQWYQDPGAATTITVGNEPTDIAFSGTNLYVTNLLDDTVSVINPTTNTIIDIIDVGNGPSAIAYNGTNLYATNAISNTVSVINPATNTVIDTVTGLSKPFGIAYDGTNMYVTNNGDDNVSVINPATNSETTTIDVGVGPQSIAYDGSNMYVTNFGDGTVSVISPGTNTVIGTIPVGNNPWGIAYDGTNIFVANISGATVSKILPL
jgi:YVTN family beta-propeller protein